MEGSYTSSLVNPAETTNEILFGPFLPISSYSRNVGGVGLWGAQKLLAGSCVPEGGKNQRRSPVHRGGAAKRQPNVAENKDPKPDVLLNYFFCIERRGISK
jgi:hypothetical protein